MFSCEFCEISKNTFFTEHLRTTTSNFLAYAFDTLLPVPITCEFNQLPNKQLHGLNQQ